MWFVMMAVALGISEMPYDGIDQDGDGFDLVDVDGDGWASELAFGRDCNDRDASVHPGAWDRPGDGIDADCDGADGGSLLALVPGPSGPLTWLLAGALLGFAMGRRGARSATAPPPTTARR